MKINIKKIQAEKPIKELLNFSLINIDKPTGPTSFQVSQFVKNTLNLKKTSHMGTLDPQVTGVLPITLGRACRLAEYFMHKNKTYVGIMRLHSDVPLSKLRSAMKSFEGEITQTPPLRSRVKRAPRQRKIYKFKFLEKQNKDVLFEAEVQAGTYIRTLCVDLGKKINGAHMLELRRTKAGIFDESTLINLYDFEKATKDESELRKILIPAEILSIIYPVVQVKESSVKSLLVGKPLHKSDLEENQPIPQTEKILVFHNQIFLQTATVINDGDIISKPDFVLN
jgi:H/ACA ribonucleoprotein complex subunit 4